MEKHSNHQNTVEKSKEKASFSSPTSAVSAEETRILDEYIDQQNMFKIIHMYEPNRKTLTLKKFFKMKRNQQVVITPLFKEEGSTIEGKVTTIGRDFVMITNLHKRIWMPYSAIESANIPFGMPTYSNPHQHHIYDNQLSQNLVLAFGKTVTKRDALIQQFFEESLRTNLSSWKDTWVKVKTDANTEFGKILKTDKKELTLKHFKSRSIIPLKEIQYVSTVRFFALWKEIATSIFAGKKG